MKIVAPKMLPFVLNLIISGHASEKHKGASVTLATSVVEDLNVLNVVTADRVVAQISTTHFPAEYSPEVTFLGTHFEHLRIARHRAEPYLRLDLAGERPAGATGMHLDQGTGFMKAVEAQYQRLKARLESLGGGCLLAREEERETLPLCADEGIGTIVWSPLARGRLTRGWNQTTRRSQTDPLADLLYMQEASDHAIIDAVASVAEGRGVNPA